MPFSSAKNGERNAWWQGLDCSQSEVADFILFDSVCHSEGLSRLNVAWKLKLKLDLRRLLASPQSLEPDTVQYTIFFILCIVQSLQPDREQLRCHKASLSNSKVCLILVYQQHAKRYHINKYGLKNSSMQNQIMSIEEIQICKKLFMINLTIFNT